MSENNKSFSPKQQVLIGSAAIAGFLSTTFVFFSVFKEAQVELTTTAILSIVAGGIIVWIILSVCGLLKELTIKGGSLEFSAKFKEEIKNVKDDVKESKREINERINNLQSTIVQTKFNQVIAPTFHIGEIEKLENLTREARSNIYSRQGIDSTKIELGKKIDAGAKKQSQVLGEILKELKNFKLASPQFKEEFDRDTLLEESNIAYYEDRYDDSLDIVNRILKENENDAVALQTKGRIFGIQENHNEALKYTNASQKIFEKENNEIGLIHTHIDLATIYGKQEKWDKSLDELNIAEKMAEKLHSKFLLSVIYNNMSIVFRRTGKLTNALKSIKKAQLIYEELDDKKGIGLGHINQGMINKALKKYDEALKSYKNAEKIGKTINDNEVIKLSFLNTANTYFTMKKNKQALEYIDKGLEIVRHQKLKMPEVHSLINKAKILRSMNRKDDFTKSVKAAKKILQEFEIESGYSHPHQAFLDELLEDVVEEENKN